MPYIKPERRQKIDNDVASLLATLDELHQDDGNALKTGMTFVGGDLNYALSRIIWTLFEARKNYATAAELVATLDCVKMEFYRRKVAPYEDEKAEQHGDL